MARCSQNILARQLFPSAGSPSGDKGRTTSPSSLLHPQNVHTAVPRSREEMDYSSPQLINSSVIKMSFDFPSYQYLLFLPMLPAC